MSLPFQPSQTATLKKQDIPLLLSACLPESHQKIASALNTRLFTGISLDISPMAGYPYIQPAKKGLEGRL
jgi:hypothetical protein